MAGAPELAELLGAEDEDDAEAADASGEAAPLDGLAVGAEADALDIGAGWPEPESGGAEGPALAATAAVLAELGGPEPSPAGALGVPEALRAGEGLPAAVACSGFLGGAAEEGAIGAGRRNSTGAAGA